MRRKSSFTDLIVALGTRLLQEAAKDIDQNLKEKKKKEKSQKLRKDSIDVEYKVVEEKSSAENNNK